MMLTPFGELDSLLLDHADAVRGILGAAFVGCYLQGSFALGAGDVQSDADFIVVTTGPPADNTEARLRELHAEIPGRPGMWYRNLEGSYVDAASLRGLSGLGVPWLYCNRGHRELIWSEHDNSAHTRWILRERGLVVQGPPIRDLVDEVPDEAMRREARELLPGLLASIREWADLDNAWTQRFIVQTYCRVLYTSVTAEVASKGAALEWGQAHLDGRWGPLLAQVAADRALPWTPVDPPRPGSMARALEFAVYAETLVH